MHCNTTPCNKNNAVPYVKTWYKIISIATYTEIKIHRSQSFSHLRQYSFGRANKRRVEGAQSWMKYRELLYSFSLRQGRQEVEIQSGSQVCYAMVFFVSFSWLAGGGNYVLQIVNWGSSVKFTVTTLGVFIFAFPFRSYLGRTRDHTSNCRSPHLSVSSLFQTRI